MRLIIINDGFYPERIGGAEIQIMNIKFGLESLGWTVRLIDSRSGLKSCLIEARKFRPNIVYQRGRKGATWIAFLISKKLDIPFIFSASMNIDFFYLKKCQEARVDKNRAFPSKIYRISRYFREDLLSLIAMLNADSLLAQNEEQKLLGLKKYSKHSTIIPNYHVVDKISNRETEVFRVLWLASLKKWKQPEVFVELSRLFEDFKNIEFVLAGNIVDVDYESLCVFWKGYPNVKIINDVDYEYSKSLITSANVFVNTSNGNEGFPNTFIMSWLSGVPVVSYGFNVNTPMRNIGFISCNESMDRMRDEILREYLACENNASRTTEIKKKAEMEYSFSLTIGALHNLIKVYV